MQPINMIKIYDWDKYNSGQLEHILNKCMLWDRDIKSIFFLKLLLHQIPGHAIFFFNFLSQLKSLSYQWITSILRQFWMILSPSSDVKYLFLSCPRHFDRGLTVVIVYYFQISKERKKEKKKNTTVLSLLCRHPIFVVRWIPSILRNPILAVW